MTYEETLHYLYAATPVYEHKGPSAYKPGLGTSIALDDHLGNPHRAYKTIHVAGTNGKGSVSHLLAAILQRSGYKVGLYTSPHLTDFRERIRVNGKMIPKPYVVDFVERYRSFFEPLHPSFFELTSTMAFQYFKDCQVDYAVIEVGLGGRLDSTNIILPILSVITNISKDHVQFLGDTEEKIAAEKAGIIKPNVPILLGAKRTDPILEVIRQKADEEDAPFFHAMEMGMVDSQTSTFDPMGKWIFDTTEYGLVKGELGGSAQLQNASTVLSAVHILRTRLGVAILPEAVHEGFSRVTQLTGLRGRWQTVSMHPRTICDMGHNVGAWSYLSQQLDGLRSTIGGKLRMVVGMVSDKDVEGVLSRMPREACYYFTQPSVPRGMSAREFADKAVRQGLKGQVYADAYEAYGAAYRDSQANDLIFIGGSTFVLADVLPHILPEEEPDSDSDDNE